MMQEGHKTANHDVRVKALNDPGPNDPAILELSCGDRTENVEISPNSPLRKVQRKQFKLLMECLEEELLGIHKSQIKKFEEVKEGSLKQKVALSTVKGGAAAAAGGFAGAALVPVTWPVSLPGLAVSGAFSLLTSAVDFGVNIGHWKGEIQHIFDLSKPIMGQIKGILDDLQGHVQVFEKIYDLKEYEARCAVILESEFNTVKTVKYIAGVLIAAGRKFSEVVAILRRSVDGNTKDGDCGKYNTHGVTELITGGISSVTTAVSAGAAGISVARGVETTVGAVFSGIGRVVGVAGAVLSVADFVAFTFMDHPVTKAANKAIEELENRLKVLRIECERLRIKYATLCESEQDA